MTLSSGYSVEGLTVVRRLGSGGSGVAYLVHNTRLDRYECMKVYRSTRIEDSDNPWHEARTAGATGVPGVVTVYSAGNIDTSSWYTMEYSALGDLRRAISRPKDANDDRYRTEQEQYRCTLLLLLRDVADALDSLHQLDVPIIHGDVKPENILVFKGSNGKLRAKLSDFGLASTALPTVDGSTPSAPISGTLPYLAPERFQGRQPSPASDRYAFACAAFEMLTGKRPFSAEGLPPNAETVEKIAAYRQLHQSEIRPAPGNIDPSLRGTDQALRQALAVDAEDRQPTATQFLDELEGSLKARPSSEKSVKVRTAAFAGVGTAATVVVASTAYLLTSTSPDEKPTETVNAAEYTHHHELDFIGQGCPSRAAAGSIRTELENASQYHGSFSNLRLNDSVNQFPDVPDACTFGGHMNATGLASDYHTALYIFNSNDENTRTLRDRLLNTAVYNPGTITDDDRVNLDASLIELTARYAVEVHGLFQDKPDEPTSTCALETEDKALTVVQINYNATRDDYGIGAGVSEASFACSEARELIKAWAETS